MDNRKPCPFCGGTQIRSYKNNDKEYTHSCDQCKYTLRCFTESYQSSINKWNTRPLEDALRKDNQLLRDIMEYIKDEFPECAGLENVINDIIGDSTE